MASRPTPVVHVITKLELGGAQQNTLHTVEHLDRTRFAPHLVCGTEGMLDDEARALKDVGLTFLPELVRPIHPPKDLLATWRLAALLRPLVASGPVIVHTHSSKAGIVGRAAARLAGAGPVVHSIHGFGHGAISNAALRWLTLATERLMARCTDAFIAVSECNRREGDALSLLGGRPCEIIRSGIDLDDFARADGLRAQVRQSLGYADGVPVVGMIACLKPQKAPLDFVELVRLVSERVPTARFFVAGDGELRSQVEARLLALGLTDKVQLLGWRRDIPGLLGALDVAVLTSRWEGLPRVCPQAMAASRPMVATAVDGTPEAIVDGQNGFLVEPGQMEDAAERVVQLLGDPDLRSRLGQRGQQDVASFGQEEMVVRQEALYERLLLEKS
ncbi:MAG: glycosyltransferase involved in cell wall biosynthesis [Pseudohongiellaceae bacterium]|jgi:glycosyltransferase involved in cell wall biosynthesis